MKELKTSSSLGKNPVIKGISFRSWHLFSLYYFFSKVGKHAKCSFIVYHDVGVCDIYITHVDVTLSITFLLLLLITLNQNESKRMDIYQSRESCQSDFTNYAKWRSCLSMHSIKRFNSIFFIKVPAGLFIPTMAVGACIGRITGIGMEQLVL